MAIIVDKDGNVVTVENQPENERAMFPNLRDGEQAVAAAEAAALRAESAAEQAMSGTPDGYSNLVGSIADAFSSGADYKAGDYVLYESTLYRFIADHEAGTWSDSDVEVITVGEDLTDLNITLHNALMLNYADAIHVTEQVDLNSIVTPGTYYFDNGNNVSNFISGVSKLYPFILVVSMLDNGTYAAIRQTYTSLAAITRYREQTYASGVSRSSITTDWYRGIDSGYDLMSLNCVVQSIGAVALNASGTASGAITPANDKNNRIIIAWLDGTSNYSIWMFLGNMVVEGFGNLIEIVHNDNISFNIGANNRINLSCSATTETSPYCNYVMFYKYH